MFETLTSPKVRPPDGSSIFASTPHQVWSAGGASFPSVLSAEEADRSDVVCE
ncbi:hypothetical protein [Rhodococcus erythropolis]|uniref:hypothetical protein n=1 Tax=Rhodococcus erythropolis TaxID=1833 RepID=UPI00404213A5